MAKHATRKENRAFVGSMRHLPSKARSKAKAQLKKATAKASRAQPIGDELPYKRLDDPWNYD